MIPIYESNDFEFWVNSNLSSLNFFSIWVFFHEHSRFTGQQGKGEGIYLTPLYHFHPLHRHLHISREITAGGSPLHIASSWTRTGNLRFASASRWPLSYASCSSFSLLTSFPCNSITCSNCSTLYGVNPNKMKLLQIYLTLMRYKYKKNLLKRYSYLAEKLNNSFILKIYFLSVRCCTSTAGWQSFN